MTTLQHVNSLSLYFTNYTDHSDMWVSSASVARKSNTGMSPCQLSETSTSGEDSYLFEK